MIFLTLNKPYYLLTEEQKVRARAAKKRWRDKNRSKQHALTVAWQRRNRARINKQYRDRYAANPELYRAKLKAKRARMGTKYRAQIKRARSKMRSTPEGMRSVVAIELYRTDSISALSWRPISRTRSALDAICE